MREAASICMGLNGRNLMLPGEAAGKWCGWVGGWVATCVWRQCWGTGVQLLVHKQAGRKLHNRK